MSNIDKSIRAWSSMHISGTHHKSPQFQNIFTVIRVRIALAQGKVFLFYLKKNIKIKIKNQN